MEVLYTLWLGVTVLMLRLSHAQYCPDQRLKVIIIIKTKTTIVPVVTVVPTIIRYLQVFKCVNLAFQGYLPLRYCFR